MKKILLSILLIIPFVSISTFAINWDNTNFLDETFWTQNPTSGDIINALYGDGVGDNDRTAYTTNWTGIICSTGNMQVVYLDPGTNTIPFNLSGNMIYILNEGNYITTGIINMTGCSAIVGSGLVGLYSSTGLSQMIYNYQKENAIIDNINIDGLNDGIGGTHTNNTYGIYLNLAKNNTTNNIRSYNNSDGIRLFDSEYNTINNSQFFNNTSYGIYIYRSNNNTLNNILSYNNNYGILFDGSIGSKKNSINNSQFFNNTNGVYFNYGEGEKNILSNISIYNNSNYGLYIRGRDSSYWKENIFSNINIYNNYRGFYVDSRQSTGNLYYNDLNIHSNGINIGGTNLNDNYVKPGTGGVMGRNDGVANISDINIDLDYVTWPNSFYLQGDFLKRGRIASYNISSQYYKYGNNLLKQTNPIHYNGLGILDYSFLPHFPEKIIGEISKIDLLGNSSIFQSKINTEKNDIKIQLFSYETGVNYNIYGDIAVEKTGYIGEYTKTVSLFLSDGFGEKNIYVSYYTGNKNSPTYKININYIQNYNSIVIKYFGFDSYYTKNREKSDCDINEIYVETINPGKNTIPSALNQNTIYILNSGDYIIDYTINMDNCSAIVGSGLVGLYSSTGLSQMIYNYQKENAIIDNINIDGLNDGIGGTHTNNTYGIYLNLAKNNTTNNVRSYNNSDGIRLFDSEYNTINNSQFFNNNAYSIYIYRSNNNTFNNILSYNNNYGILFDGSIGSKKNSINNSQFFNNTNGVYFNYGEGQENILSNISIYNNSNYGLYIRGRDSSYWKENIFSNINIYNNYRGFYVDSRQSTGNLYYNDLNIYSNGTNIGGTNLNDNYVKPGTGGLMGRNDGQLFVGNLSISSQNIINPKDENNDFLIDTKASTSSRRGRNSDWSGNGEIKYSFGNDLTNQFQPIKYGSFYDQLHKIYFTNYEKVEYSNLSRDGSFPIGLDNFDLETYFGGNGYLKGTGSISNVSSDTYVGNTPIKGDFLNRFADGKTNFPIILQSTGTNPIEAAVPANTYIKNISNESYTGLIQAPIVIATGGISEVPNVCSAISVGKYGGESIYFKDANGNPTTVNVTMPVDTCGGFATGSNIGVYTREGTGPWTYITNATITTINNTKYVTFDTIHFTDFAVGGVGTGTFVINNDAPTTNSLEVILNMTMPMVISGMKFSNDGATRTDWEDYVDTKSRTLTGNDGIKTVYVAFDYDGDNIADIQISDSITYDLNGSSNNQGNISLTITGGITECVYGTSLYLGDQDVNIDPSGYTFSGDFSPSSWYCTDFKGFDGWAFYIHTSDLSNEKSNIISGSHVLISHDTPTIQGHDSCTGYNGSPTTFNNGTGLVLMEKSNVPDNKKICRVDISNVKLEVNVPPYQAPGNYSGTLTITIPNGFNE